MEQILSISNKKKFKVTLPADTRLDVPAPMTSNYFLKDPIQIELDYGLKVRMHRAEYFIIESPESESTELTSTQTNPYFTAAPGTIVYAGKCTHRAVMVPLDKIEKEKCILLFLVSANDLLISADTKIILPPLTYLQSVEGPIIRLVTEATVYFDKCSK